MNGSGIFGDIWKGLKSGYNWVKKNVIDTDVYQKTFKPIVRCFVHTADTALNRIAPNLAPVIDAGVNEIGNQTGAYGLRKTKAQKKAMLQGRGLYLS
jgi:hypothetical protein